MRKLKLLFAAALMLSMHFLWAQTHEITGRVADDKGNPVIGVTVNVKNSRTGTTTAPDGSFKINRASQCCTCDQCHRLRIKRNQGRLPNRSQPHFFGTGYQANERGSGNRNRGCYQQKKAGYFRRINQWRQITANPSCVN